MRFRILVLVLLLFFFGANAYSQIGQYALKFNGSSDYISVPYSASLNFTQFTIEAWIFKTDSDNTKIVGKTVVNSHATGFVFGTLGNKLQIEVRETDTGNKYLKIASTQEIPLNKWTHVAMSWSTGGYLRGYINGVEVITSSTTPTLNIATNNDMYIGRAPWSHVIEDHFGGYMDEIRIWNVQKQGDEIRESMYKTLTGSEANLEAYYSMNDGTGTTLTDISGHSHNGAINGPVWKASGAMDGSRKALVFDTGLDDYISFTEESSPAFYNDNLTIEAWIKSTSWADEKEIVGWGKSGNTQAVEFRMNGGVLQYGSNVGDWQHVEGHTRINTGEWVHVALTKDGNAVSLYVNGKLDATGTNTLIPDVNRFAIANLFQNGAYHDDGRYNFEGQIDEIRIWHATRSEDQIRANMTKSLTGKEANLVAYYRFDEGANTVLHDITGNGKNGILQNMNAETSWVDSHAFDTWIGTENSAFNNSANWSDGVPASAHSIGLYKWDLSNVTTYHPDITGNPTLNNAFLSNNSLPTMSSGMTIRNNMVLNWFIVVGNSDLEIGGALLGNGLVDAHANGYLALKPLQGISTRYPLVIGEHAYWAFIDCGNAPTQPVKIKINPNKNIAAAAMTEFWDISGENNLNATLRLMLYKAQLKDGKWDDTNHFRIFNGTRYVPIPSDQVTVQDLGNSLGITITGLNSF